MTDHREIANKLRERVIESINRCDTDGFVSQYFMGISAHMHDLQADIDENGGFATFPALYKNEERVPAKLVYPFNRFTGRKEATWRVEEASGEVTWIPAFKEGRNSKLHKLGYVEGSEIAPAVAYIDGEGHGLSGRAWAAIRRTDGGYPGATTRKKDQ